MAKGDGPLVFANSFRTPQLCETAEDGTIYTGSERGVDEILGWGDMALQLDESGAGYGLKDPLFSPLLRPATQGDSTPAQMSPISMDSTAAKKLPRDANLPSFGLFEVGSGLEDFLMMSNAGDFLERNMFFN